MGSIKDKVSKIKNWFSGSGGRGVMLVTFAILLATLSFGLGRLSKIEERRQPIQIKLPPAAESGGNLTASAAGKIQGETTVTPGRFVASKSGAKYHLPWCPGALRIKEENKIWFATAEEAKSRGYTPAANCPGL